MAYVTLYRKYRPQTFEEVLGQEYVTRILSNSLRNGNLAHAYLFAGPRGTGKTSTARILAKALNCEEGPTPIPCNRCDSCRQITEGTSVDIVEIDAASNRGIDDIRDLRERVAFSPAAARMKVYILDEAHMLTPPAFNALLKMLEEPPAHVVFVLATTEPHKMPPTILSRCQRLDFRSVPASRLVDHLARVCEEEKANATEGALRLIARRARGSARDALVILEQAISYGDGAVEESEVASFLGMVEDEMLARLGDCLASGDAAGVIAMVEQAYEQGRDLLQFAREAQEHFRRVFLLQHAKLDPEDLEVDEGAYEHLLRQAGELSPSRALQFIDSLREAAREMQASPSPRLVLEGALIGMARSELDASPQALAARLDRLEGEVERWLRRRSAAPAPPRERIEAAEGEAQPAERIEEVTDAEALAAQPRAEAEAAEVSAEAGAAPPEEPPLPPTPDFLDLAAVRRAWPQVKEKVKERKITTHAFLLEGRPVGVKKGELTIAFPADRSFHRGEMEKEDHRRVLEEALERVLGVGLKVVTAIEPEVRGRREEEPKPAAPATKGGRGGSRGRRKAPDEEAKTAEVEPQQEQAEAATTSGEEEPWREEGARQEEAESAGTAEEDDAAAGIPRHTHEDMDVEKPEGESHEAGKVKLVKDIFGAEMIEEIKLRE